MKIVSTIALIIIVLALNILLVSGILSIHNYVKYYEVEDLCRAITCFVFFLILALVLTLLVLAFILL